MIKIQGFKRNIEEYALVKLLSISSHERAKFDINLSSLCQTIPDPKLPS